VLDAFAFYCSRLLHTVFVLLGCFSISLRELAAKLFRRSDAHARLCCSPAAFADITVRQHGERVFVLVLVVYVAVVVVVTVAFIARVRCVVFS